MKGKSVKSLLHSVPDCQAIIKKAIVERLRGKYPGVGWFEERGPVYGVEFKLTKDLVTVVLDTTGEGLHKRGWRKLGSSAPLKETLASVLLTLSNWRPDQPLVDPFCGSGTIPIEAALKAMNVAPGLIAALSAENWSQMPKALWSRLREEAREAVIPQPKLPYRGL